MSLLRIAIRIAAIEAIKGQTFFADNVLDSEIGAIEFGPDGTIKTDKEKPFIAVYTDRGVQTYVGDVRSMFDGGDCDLVFELGVSKAMAITDEETGGDEVIVGVPATDANFEFLLDMTARQIVNALTRPLDDEDPGSVWAEIFRGLVLQFNKIERLRAGNADGVRLAGHQIKVTLQTIDDPITGEALLEGAPVAAFIDQLIVSGVTQYAVYAAAFQGAIAGVNADWETTRRRWGMTNAELLALGIGPIVQDEDRETPIGEETTVEIEGRDNEVITDD